MAGSRYVKAPVPPEHLQALYDAVLQVLSGAMTVTDAAGTVGLSRLRFQTRMNRGLHGLLETLDAQPRGRKPTPESEQALKEQVHQLQRENAELQRQVEASARMMQTAGEWMRKGLQTASRRRRTRPTAEAAVSDTDDDGPARLLDAANELRMAGVSTPLIVTATGVSAPTARRWRRRRRAGEAMRRKRGPRPHLSLPAQNIARARTVLSKVRGCVGATPLARASGLTRRMAAAVKAEQLTQWERERRAEAVRVTVVPGVVRGFDAIDVGGVPVLVSADGAVPYRTSAHVAERYDSAAVSAAAADDFERNGAPLVWRVDRWKAHVTDDVRAVLDKHQVLLMHGPPRHPRFYGQLERQNREHRAWFDALEANVDLRRECEAMREAFNELVPRRTLGWRTAGEAWRSRERVTVDRRELKQEVDERIAKLSKQEALRGAYPGLIERLAIQAALTQRGLLRLTKGGWC